MGLFTKDIKTMDDLFVHQLQDIYYAEKQLVKALPKSALGGATDGQAGIRINHNMDLHIDGFALKKG